MENVLIKNENFDKDDTTYLLDKAIWDDYDMVKTRTNVIEFLQKYKEARSKYLGSLMSCDWGLTSNIEISKVSSSFRSNNGFAQNSDVKMDAEALLNATSPLIAKLKASFTNEEKIYYDYCLAANRSEQTVCNMLNISRPGLAPIKNSCLLKIAFATNNAIRKTKH